LYRKIEEQVEQSFRMVYDRAIQFYADKKPAFSAVLQS
jgi:hypothetical protein